MWFKEWGTSKLYPWIAPSFCPISSFTPLSHSLPRSQLSLPRSQLSLPRSQLSLPRSQLSPTSLPTFPSRCAQRLTHFLYLSSQIVTSSHADLHDYTYYFVAAPWLSVKIMRLLQCFPIPGLHSLVFPCILSVFSLYSLVFPCILSVFSLHSLVFLCIYSVFSLYSLVFPCIFSVVSLYLLCILLYFLCLIFSRRCHSPVTTERSTGRNSK